MSESQGTALDLSTVNDPDVRRALRHLQQQVDAAIQKQQMQFEAMLEMLFEKHVGSIGEFRRHMMRLQQKDPRGQRLHDQLNAAPQPLKPAPGR